MQEKILVAVALQRYSDFTPHALAVREVALVLAKALKARVYAFTSFFRTASEPDGETYTDKLSRFVAPFKEAGIELETVVTEGSPRELIPKVATEIGATLIVMGAHSKRGPLDISLGGTAAAVVKEAPCRVILVAPPKDEALKTRELAIDEYPDIFPYIQMPP